MREQTDLSGVKRMANMLLILDVTETKFSPAIVQHPFTSSGYVLLREKGGTRFADITKSRENLKLWQSNMRNEINSKRSAFEVYMLINKPYRLTFLKFGRLHLSQDDFSIILADAWISSENPNMDPNLTRCELVDMFKSANPTELMSKDERETLNQLNEEVTVYRGVTQFNAKNIRALSWTLDYDKAEWFAARYGESGTIYEARIKKQRILAYFCSRGESEIIVDPKYLSDITQAQEPNERMILTQS